MNVRKKIGKDRNVIKEIILSGKGIWQKCCGWCLEDGNHIRPHAILGVHVDKFLVQVLWGSMR